RVSSRPRVPSPSSRPSTSSGARSWPASATGLLRWLELAAASTLPVDGMEASIQEVARLTGTTSRALRHYDAIGLLPPSRVGDNGYRWYDDRALVRLQRILLLRGLGLGLPDIGRVLSREQDETAALRA